MRSKNLLKAAALAPFLATTLMSCFSHTPLPPIEDGKVAVIFKNYDGKILQSNRIEKGSNAEYKSAVPTKPKDKNSDEYGNIFIGWDKSLESIDSNTTFIAQYQKLDKFIDADNDGMPEGIDDDDKNNHFDVETKSMVVLDQNINIDFSKFLIPDYNTKYDNDIAKLGLFLSDPHINFNDNKFKPSVYGGYENAMYARLGFDDFQHFDFKDTARDYYKYDKFDTTSGVVAHKNLYKPDGVTVAKDLIVIAFEGTNGKNRWASNFDVGYNDANYYDKVGGEALHPEWDKKDYHKGFYIGAKRVFADKIEYEDGTLHDGPVRFLKYIEEHSTHSNGLPIIFVTGHSRGGAMANLVGTYLETRYKDGDNPKCIPFTYTFAAPNTNGADTVISTTTIFNIINKDDFVPKVPFSGWGFNHVGNDIINVSVKDNYKELYDKNKSKRLYDCLTNPDAILANLKCGGREEIYNFNVSGAENRYLSLLPLNEESFSTETEANTEKAKLEGQYQEDLGSFANFVQLKVIKTESALYGDYYDIYANCCVGTITALAQKVMTNDSKVMENMKKIIPLMSNKLFLEFSADLLLDIFPEGLDRIKLPHDYGAYHIILREYKQD